MSSSHTESSTSFKMSVNFVKKKEHLGQSSVPGDRMIFRPHRDYYHRNIILD